MPPSVVRSLYPGVIPTQPMHTRPNATITPNLARVTIDGSSSTDKLTADTKSQCFGKIKVPRVTRG